jgi:hypothetical protein
MFSNKRVRNILAGVPFDTLRRSAPRVERIFLGAPPQELNSPAISDSDEQIKIQREGFLARNGSIAPAMLVAKLNRG